MRYRYFVLLAILALVTMAGPRPAVAGVPSPLTSTVPTHIVMVGTDANGVADPLGTVSITVRQQATLCPGSTVLFDFADAPDLVPCLSQPDPSIQLICWSGYRVIRGVTDSQGVLTFRLVGRANRSAVATPASVKIYADNIYFGTIPVAAVDQDGGGAGPADQSLWLSDYFSGENMERSDFDGDGVVGPADLSLWLEAFFGAGSIQNRPIAICP